MDTIVSVIFFLIIVVPSLSVHEFAHAWASTRLGDVTPRLHGRLTLNPLAHIDPIGTIAVPLILSFMGAGVIGWAKPVPINPNAYRKPIQGEFLVAIAGPLSNIILGIILIILMVIIASVAHTTTFGTSSSWVILFLQMGALTNFMLAFFNLLPIPPLDGYRIITLIAPSTKTRILRNQQWIMYALFAVMISPLGGYVVDAIMRLSQ
ncbi:MAG: site-2 protease family protein [Candidatus Peribacteria bacterium]|nr:MAG: site-2 protease family protein [Candidatus Peribacteria bacterium]